MSATNESIEQGWRNVIKVAVATTDRLLTYRLPTATVENGPSSSQTRSKKQKQKQKAQAAKIYDLELLDTIAPPELASSTGATFRAVRWVQYPLHLWRLVIQTVSQLSSSRLEGSLHLFEYDEWEDKRLSSDAKARVYLSLEYWKLDCLWKAEDWRERDNLFWCQVSMRGSD